MDKFAERAGGCLLVVLFFIGVFYYAKHGKLDSKPDLPVQLLIRDSAVGRGKVVGFSNQSANRLTISVVVEDKQRSNKKSFAVDLAPNAREDFGWLEGWRFSSGDRISITHPDYAEAKFDVS